MTANTGKIVSMGVVGVMVGYCCWPHVIGRGQSLAAQRAEPTPAIAASLLVPVLEPAPDRDPFRTVLPNQTAAQEWTPPVDDAVPTKSKPETGNDAENETDSDAAEAARTLALSATFVRGDQRVALINGRVYSAGEPLADSGTAASPFIVAEILADRVVIERNGQTAELSYPDATSPARPAPRTGVPSTRQLNKPGGWSPPKASHSRPARGPSRP